jgi:hypothetical protein
MQKIKERALEKTIENVFVTGRGIPGNWCQVFTLGVLSL